MSVSREEFENLARRVRLIETEPTLVIVNRHTATLDRIEKTMALNKDLIALREEVRAFQAGTREDFDALNAKIDQVIGRLS